MGNFDLKSALLARHAQHVVLVHFPIGLFLTAVAFDFVGQWRRKAPLLTVAYYNFSVAAFSSWPRARERSPELQAGGGGIGSDGGGGNGTSRRVPERSEWLKARR